MEALGEVEETSEEGLVAVKVVNEERELVFKEDKVSLDRVDFLGREARGRDLKGFVDELFSKGDGLSHRHVFELSSSNLLVELTNQLVGFGLSLLSGHCV